MVPEFVARTRGSNRVQARPADSKWNRAASLPESAMPTGNPQELLRIRRIRELQSMVPEFVARIGGSKWNRALPGGPAD